MGHFQHVVWLAVILAAAAVLPDTPERGSPANQLDPKEQRKSSIVLNTKQGKSLQSVLCVWKGGLSITVLAHLIIIVMIINKKLLLKA